MRLKYEVRGRQSGTEYFQPLGQFFNEQRALSFARSSLGVDNYREIVVCYHRSRFWRWLSRRPPWVQIAYYC